MNYINTKIRKGFRAGNKFIELDQIGRMLKYIAILTKFHINVRFTNSRFQSSSSANHTQNVTIYSE